MLSFFRRPAQLAALVLLAAGTVACSNTEEKRRAYLQSKSIAPLQVPAPLSTPVGNEVLALPALGASAGQLEGIDSRPPNGLPEETDSTQAPE